MLLQIEELTKVYRNGTRANDGISLSVGEGEVFGLLGHNGAGKTTLVNQVVGLLRPTSGSIRVDGRDMVADPAWPGGSVRSRPRPKSRSTDSRLGRLSIFSATAGSLKVGRPAPPRKSHRRPGPGRVAGRGRGQAVRRS